MKVMVVDDVGYVRHYLDRLLTENGHSVITASSGIEAIEILKQDNIIQAVLTDLLMPGMDGIELFHAARRINRFNDKGELPPPEFILLTALRPNSAMQRKEASLLQQAMAVGFVDVMLKPVDNDYLIQLLAKIEAKSDESAPAPLDAEDASSPAQSAPDPQDTTESSSADDGRQEADVWEALDDLRKTTQDELRRLRTQCDRLRRELKDARNETPGEPSAPSLSSKLGESVDARN